MRIALCLHGLSSGHHTYKGGKRQFGAGLNLYGLKNLQSRYQTDVFVHTWNPDQKAKIQEKYEPVRMEAEKATPKVRAKVMMLDRYPEHQKILDQISKNVSCRGHYAKYSNYYSLNRVNELRREYEQENKIRYDCVIQTRFDIFFYLKTALENYDLKNKIHFLSYGKYHQNQKLMLDYLFFSGPELMDSFCQIYHDFPKLVKVLQPNLNPKTTSILSNHWIIACYCYRMRKEEIGAKICYLLRSDQIQARKITKPGKLNQILTKLSIDPSEIPK